MTAVASPAPAPGTLTDYALRYAALGFRVLPLYGLTKGLCSCGRAGCPSPGKHPFAPFVTNGSHGATRDSGVLSRWFDGADTSRMNIGIAFDDDVFAVDIDPRNGGDTTWEVLVEKYGAIPDTATANTGGGGVHYLFRKPKGATVAGKLGKGVDVRSTNGLIVVEPSIHISGQQYAWLAEADPLDGTAIADAPAWMLTIGAQSHQAATIVAAEILPARKVKEIRSALAFIDCEDRDTWLRVGMALHSTNAGQQAYGLWVEWSQASAKYDAPVQKKTWASFKEDKPGKTMTGLASLFGMAKANNWTEPKEGDDEIRALVNRAPTEPETVAADPELPQCPASHAGALFAQLEQGVGLPRPAALAAGITILAALTARRYTEPTHLYVTLAAPTATLHAARRVVLDTLEACGQGELIRASRVGTINALYEAIYRSPARCYLAEDILSQANTARRQNTGSFDHLWSYLSILLDEQRVRLDSAHEAGAGLPKGEPLTIEAPAFSWLALACEDDTEILFNRRSQLRVALRQSAWFETTDVPALAHEQALPAEMLGRAKLIAPPRDGFAGAVGMSPTLPPTLRTVGVPDGVVTVLAHLSKEDRRNARRIAAAIAAWESPELPALDPLVVEWAVQLVRSGSSTFDVRWQHEVNDDGRRSVTDGVLAYVKKAKQAGASVGRIVADVRAFKALDAEKRELLLDQMQQDGDVVIVRGARGGAKVIASRYVKKEGDAK
jgi:hypothetical protein